jgi:peptidoglycan/LPS O-acetylase OafA/YrhL
VLSYDAFREERRFPSLDGLRAVSILLVLTWHTNTRLWNRLEGWEGVTIFFVISGFLITTLCLREEDREGRMSLSAFYVRRAFRILPLYYIVLAAYIVVVIGANAHGHRSLLTAALPYFLTYTNDFAPLQGDTPFAQSWSLGVEEKFYLVWPALAFVLLLSKRRLRLPLAALLAATPFLLLPFGVLAWFAHYSAIMVGCFLALLMHQRRSFELLAWLARPVGAFAALTALVLLHVLIPSGQPDRLAYPFAVAAVMVSLVAGATSLSRVLRTRSMRFLGNLAYGVYLIHLMVLSVIHTALRHAGMQFDGAERPVGGWSPTMVVFVFGATGSFLVAYSLNRLIEAPMISRGRAISARRRQRAEMGVAGEVASP